MESGQALEVALRNLSLDLKPVEGHILTYARPFCIHETVSQLRMQYIPYPEKFPCPLVYCTALSFFSSLSNAVPFSSPLPSALLAALRTARRPEPVISGSTPIPQNPP